MLAQSAQSVKPLNTQYMTAHHMIKSLRSMLPESSLISVAIMPQDYSKIIGSFTKLVVTNTPKGPAIFVGDSSLIPPTSMDALIQVFNLPSYRNYLNQPVRLLNQNDGFDLKIDVNTGQLVISGLTDTGEISVPPSIREVNDSIASLNRYGLVRIMNNSTFGTLVFVDLGRDYV